MLAPIQTSHEARNAAAMATGRARFENAPEIPDADERDPEQGADVAIELIGRACRALPRDRAAAADLLRSAAALLCEIADEVQS